MAIRTNFRNLGYDQMTDEERARIDSESFYWEAYHDVFGIKPRWMRISDWTDEELADAISEIANDLAKIEECRRADQAALAAARAHPRGIVTLSVPGEICAEYDGVVDENDPEMWNWYIQEDPAPNRVFQSIFSNLSR